MPQKKPLDCDITAHHRVWHHHTVHERMWIPCICLPVTILRHQQPWTHVLYWVLF